MILLSCANVQHQPKLQLSCVRPQENTYSPSYPTVDPNELPSIFGVRVDAKSYDLPL